MKTQLYRGTMSLRLNYSESYSSRINAIKSLQFVFPNEVEIRINSENVTSCAANFGQKKQGTVICEKTRTGFDADGIYAVYNYEFNAPKIDKIHGEVDLNYTDTLLKQDYRGKNKAEFTLTNPDFEVFLDEKQFIVLEYNFVYDLMKKNKMFTWWDKTFDKPALCSNHDRGQCITAPLWKDYIFIPYCCHSLDYTIAVIAHELGHHLDGELLGNGVLSGIFVDKNYVGEHPEYDKLSEKKKAAVIMVETVSSVNSIIICDYIYNNYGVKINPSTYKVKGLEKYYGYYEIAKDKLNGKSLEECGKLLKQISNKATYKSRKEFIEKL